MRSMVMLVLISCVGCGYGAVGCDYGDEIQELRKKQAVQEVQLQDARDRIHTLEVDLDRVAPHTPVAPPRP